MNANAYYFQLRTWCLLTCCLGLLADRAAAVPPGFVKTEISLDAPPVGLAFDTNGVLYALEGASFGSNEATLRTIRPDGNFDVSFTIVGDEGDEPGESPNFFVGGMTYDAVGDQLLITDNTADGRLYTVSKTGVKQTLSMGIAGIAGVAVRDSGEIYVSNAPFGTSGKVLQIDRTTGAATEVLGGLALGAGLAFDGPDMIVQDAYFVGMFETRGRLRKLGSEPFLDNMQSSYSVIVDSEGDIFTTGSGGLFEIKGSPVAEVSWLPSGFSAAMAFDPGPFERFAGPGGGRLALAAEASFGNEDTFVTLLTPATPGDYNGDGHVDAGDYAAWRSAYGSTDPAADGNGDGRVDGADYVVWRDHLESSGGAGATSTANVPEPFTLGLAAVAFAACGVSCRRKRLRS